METATLDELMGARRELDKAIDARIKEKFPVGSTVYFKTGNMTDFAAAEVLSVRLYSGYPYAHVTNLRTGKKREIYLPDTREWKQ